MSCSSHNEANLGTPNTSILLSLMTQWVGIGLGWIHCMFEVLSSDSPVVTGIGDPEEISNAILFKFQSLKFELKA